MSILACAPSNIALIKYMGKVDSSQNLPANGSLSLTLQSLRTEIELHEVTSNSGSKTSFRWVAELPRGRNPKESAPLRFNRLVGAPAVPMLNDAGRERYLLHAERALHLARTEVLPRLGIELSLPSLNEWEIRTSNTFPSDSGIASSASSFAALTLAVVAAQARNPNQFLTCLKNEPALARALAALSRQGSGSSCRSFEGPWVKWEGTEAEKVSSSLPPMTDLVLVVAESRKAVSSSQAHSLVSGSPLWAGRAQRVTHRMVGLRQALASGDLKVVSRIAWEEMWEMHSLFHTCPEPFTYWEPETLAILKWISPRLSDPRPPIVTLDAGPNIHVLVPTETASDFRQEVENAFPGILILQDQQGLGAEILSWETIS